MQIYAYFAIHFMMYSYKICRMPRQE